MRIATSKDFSESHRELKYRTPFADLLEMHLVLDTYERIRKEYERDRKSKTKGLPA